MQTEDLAKELLRYFYASSGEGGEELPSFLLFARRHGTNIASLRARKETDASLSDAWRECEEILAERIVDGALHKRYDASFSKFLLTSRFGYTDKQKETPDDFALQITVSDPE